MLYTSVKYLKLISPRLDRFKIKKDNGSSFLANCRCSICGDSQKHRSKARGYFYDQKGSLYYKCFNCDAALPFWKFLKTFDLSTWEQFNVEDFQDKQFLHQVKTEDVKKPKPKIVPDIFYSLKSIDELPEDHPARKVVEDRLIPEQFLSDIYYAPKFFEWTLSHTQKFKEMRTPDHPRFIIPWYSEHGEIFGYQARCFGDETPKYFSIILDKSKPKVFGLERIDKSKRVYVLEGPIDSLFIDNCVAVGDSALYKYESDEHETTYVLDNEPRNLEIVKLYLKLIRQGKDVCIWPDDWHHKDINDAVKSGLKSSEIKRIIDSNTYHDLEAFARLNEWKKRAIDEH